MKDLKNGLFQSPKKDIVSAIVVFLVALPLCLGLALACGTPLFSGIVAGVIGGIVIGYLSSSPLSVSGPAAGLVVIVLNAIEDLGSFEAFLVAVILSGIFQMILGFLKAGMVSLYFPSAVIKGMLAAIGLILILKQIPHVFGVDADAFGEMEFFEKGGSTTFSSLFDSFQHISIGSLLIGAFTIVVMFGWDKFVAKFIPAAKIVPGILMAVIFAVLANQLLSFSFADYAVSAEHMVNLPKISSATGLWSELSSPDFNYLLDYRVYVVAITLAIVASLESLLSLQAIERLDPLKRRASANRELIAQGIGNSISGFLGGLPITAVIVRSSANLAAGATSKLSAILHGVLLLSTVVLIPNILNLIPLSSLAAILIVVGFKLTKPALYKSQFKLGLTQFAPFIITIVAILFTDLLIGILIGICSGIVFILIENHRVPYFYKEIAPENKDGRTKVVIQLSEHVSFLNKASLQNTLDNLPGNVDVVINGELAKVIDHDALEAIHLFKKTAKDRGIGVEFIDVPTEKESLAMH